MKKFGVVVFLTALFFTVLLQPGEARSRHVDANGNDIRPHAWCGWWLRHHLGVADRNGNLAAWWRHFGSRANGPAIGVIVVWWHHVGIVVGREADGWIVKSGNDGHAVRERVRSLARVIAYRWPGGMAGI
jgi:hypothetical protein